MLGLLPRRRSIVITEINATEKDKSEPAGIMKADRIRIKFNAKYLYLSRVVHRSRRGVLQQT